MLLDGLLEKLSRITEPDGGFAVLPGIQALGANVHPSLVHFPIAFLPVFLLLDLLGSVLRREKLRQAASAMLYCGTLGALLAAAAGLYAASIAPHGEDVHEIMEWHKRLGLTVASLATVLSLWRLAARGMMAGMAQALHLLLAAIMTGCMVVGADLGGMMVYGHGVAVHKLQGQEAAQAHHHHGGAGTASE